VWRLDPNGASLARLPQRFESANGITISPDGYLLYVSTFPNGITVLDLKTGNTAPISRPADLCLASIDGLYFHEGSLIAIQNGFMNPRVIRLVLSRDLRGIEHYDILERRNPLFDGVTTGVIAKGEFFYMANIQDEKKSGFIPISVLKIRL
jgi:DNA-binding beta-propeller fold protein YncE